MADQGSQTHGYLRFGLNSRDRVMRNLSLQHRLMMHSAGKQIQKHHGGRNPPPGFEVFTQNLTLGQEVVPRLTPSDCVLISDEHTGVVIEKPMPLAIEPVLPSMLEWFSRFGTQASGTSAGYMKDMVDEYMERGELNLVDKLQSGRGERSIYKADFLEMARDRLVENEDEEMLKLTLGSK